MTPRPHTLAVLLLCLVHCAAAAAEQKPKAPDLHFPKLEDWAGGEQRPMPTESGGYTVSYNSDEPRIAVTVYVYNRGIAKIPDDLTSAEIQAEFTAAKESIQIAKQRGLYQEAKEEESKEATLGPDKSAPQALYARFRLTIKEQKTLSEIYVLPHKNAFVKLRITRIAHDEKATREKLDRLYAALAKTLAP